MKSKKAYYKKALELHPDKNKGPNAKEEFHKLQKIYSVLSVPLRRSDYDNYGEDADEDYEDGSDIEEVVEEWKMYSVETLEEILAAFDDNNINAGQLIIDVNFTDTIKNYTSYDDDSLVNCFKSAKKQKVSHLDLSRKEIISVPSEVGTVTTLETLILSKNKITDLPSHFSQLFYLKFLDLGVNSLTFIPKVIYSLNSLTELHLEHNKITHIDPEISQLTNLEVLNLFANQITVIPEQICSLSNIKKLDFGINFINEYPPELLEKDIELILDTLPIKPPKSFSLPKKRATKN